MFYENYLNSIKPDMSFIPESASFNDMAVFTGRAIQDAYNEAAISITCHEMAIFESALNEAEGEATDGVSTEQKKSILESIRKFFAWIWDKIKGFFSKISTAIKEIFAKVAVGAGKGTEKNFRDACAKLEDDFTAKIIPFDWDKKISQLTIEAHKITKTNADNIIGKSTKTLDELNKLYDEFVDDTKESNKAKKELEKALKTEMKDATVEVKGKEIKSRIPTIIDIVYGGKTWTKTVKASYDEIKKAIDGNMKLFKDMINNSKNKESITFAKTKLKIVKSESSQLTTITSMYNALMRKLRTNYVSLVAKVLVATKTKLTKEDVDITINTDDDKEEEEAPVVKDEIEESFKSFIKEEDEIEIGTDDDDDVEVDVEESTLYKALVSYLA